MTKKEKIALVNDLVSSKRALDDWAASLRYFFGGDCDDPVQRDVWRLFDAHTSAVARLIGDRADWLSWFVWENDCGYK